MAAKIGGAAPKPKSDVEDGKLTIISNEGDN
jgi:hypothetical protein